MLGMIGMSWLVQGFERQQCSSMVTAGQGGWCDMGGGKAGERTSKWGGCVVRGELQVEGTG